MDSFKDRLEYDLAKDILDANKIVTTYDNEELFLYEDGYFTQYGETKLKEIIQTILKGKTTKTIVSETIAHIKRSTFVDRKIFEETPLEYINLKNGVFNLKTKTLIKPEWNFMFTHKIPIEYNPNAKCPKIDKFFEEVFPNDKINLAYEMIAYCMYRAVPLQKAFMLLGTGRNGKSTYLELLTKFLGENNCTGIELQELEEGRFGVARLFGKLVNVFADLPSRALRGTSRFKTLTGGDILEAEKKFKDSFTFRPYAKMIFSANQLPRTPDDSDAFFRRWIIIEFPRQFDDETADKDLITKLTEKEELEGLLLKCLEKLTNLLETGRFSVEFSVEEMRELYIRLSDPVSSFLMDCIEVNPSSYIPKGPLYNKFVEYCKGHKYPVISERTFSKAIIKEGNVTDYYATILGQRVKCWSGIRYYNEENPDDTLNYELHF